MAEAQFQRVELDPKESPAGNSILAGASQIKVDEASFVGRDMYRYEGGPTTVQIVLPSLDSYSNLQRFGDSPSQWGSQRLQDVKPHPNRSQSLDDHLLAGDRGGQTGASSKRRPDDLGKKGRELEARERDVLRREREMEEWNIRRTQSERSMQEREERARHREQELSVRLLELELGEEKLRKAETRAEARGSAVHDKELEVERREVEVRQMHSEAQRVLKDVEEREELLRMEKAGLKLRSKDLKAMEDDISSRRREELRRQLGDSANNLLKYTTIGLQKAFGRDAALGVHRMLNQFDFASVEVGNLDKRDGLRKSLLPLYDKIDQRQMESMPENLKVALAGTIGALQSNAALRDDQTDWLVVENILMTTPQLQPASERVEYREEVEIARELKPSELSVAGQWFKNLLECDGTHESFRGVTLNVFLNVPDFIPPGKDGNPKRTEKARADGFPVEKELLDITVLWLPGNVRRFLKLSHTSIKLRVKQNTYRFGRVKQSTVISVVHSLGKTYHPRDRFVREMSEVSRQVAIQITDRLFDFS